MTLPNLVSFSGYPRSGKDSAADLLVSRARFVKCTMSQPLEQALLRMNPWIVDDKQGSIERFSDLYENLGFDATREFEETRRLLSLGTEVGRSLFGKNLWSDLVFDEVQALMDLGKKVALSGVEYPDDADRVRALGGVCVWIERRSARRGNDYGIDCDLVVSNNGTPKDLYVNLVTALEEHNETLNNLKENN